MNSSEKPLQVFPRILLPYILGVVVFYHFRSGDFIYGLIVINLALLTGLLLLNGHYLEIKAYRFKSWIGLLFHLFLFFFGGLMCYHHQSLVKQDHFSKSTTASYLKVQVTDEPQRKGDILRFKGEIKAVYLYKKQAPLKASGIIMITIKPDPKQPLVIDYGATLLIPARFTAISPPFHPAQFDYQAWLASQNIHHQSFLPQNEILKLSPNSGNRLFAFAIALRTQQVERYKKLLKDSNSVALASTLILGYRAELSKETLDIYSKTGTIHALSVSGMHVGLIYLVLNYVLAFLNRSRAWKHPKLFLILGLLWFYALLTGCTPSVLRAVLMLSVLLIGKTYSRSTNSYNILSFAAFFMLLYDPFLIWDVGFQLSFLAVLGLIYLQPKLQDCWPTENNLQDSRPFKNTLAYKLWGMISMSLSAQLFTFPLSIYYFHQFPVYFLLSNLFILLPITLLMYLGILLLIPGLDFLAPAVNWLIQFNNSGLQYLAALPCSSLTGIRISKLELLLLSISLTLGLLALVKCNWKLLIATFAVFLPLQLSISLTSVKRYHQQQVIHFNIPKHKAIAYIFSHQATVYTQLKQEDPGFRYFIQPVLDYHQIRFLKIRSLPP
ncbi:ComEC/Rec2 family competence protein [Pedobacter sp. PLR]|uniref:ComEC/Rec2 family competence protein n=1 Tax=Pedobacter sp. PLR TaxID=2994465 RepID=UPI0022467213|nr:ComEC/Rec2 family competence protein [Pedobacter sp. PLR]MCX2450213.1 ComEC/Rec2 family competence protein [Pedobacter sp. PLR]